MSDQYELSDVIIDAEFECLAAPITEPEQIKDDNVKTVVTTLMKREEKPLERIERYQLPPLPEEEDSRPWYTRAIHWARMKIPNQRTSLQKRIETDKIIARAKSQAEWLAQSVNDIQQWTTRARTAYERTAAYKTSRQAGIREMQNCFSEGEAYLQTAPEQLRQINWDLSSGEWYVHLEQKLGEKAAQRSKELLKDKGEQIKSDMAHTKQVNDYLETLISHYTEVVTVTDATLREMKTALDAAVGQRLNLAMKLDTYQGLTANQIEFTEAVRFLREVRHITDGLDSSMNAVDGTFSTEVDKYVNNAPETLRIAPSVDVAKVKLLMQEVNKDDRKI